MHCDHVSVIRSSESELLATGCGQDRMYTCDGDDCIATDANAKVSIAGESDVDPVTEVLGDMLVDMACSCASAGLTRQSHHSSSSKHARK
jgi:hypothetical protein